MLALIDDITSDDFWCRTARKEAAKKKLEAPIHRHCLRVTSACVSTKERSTSGGRTQYQLLWWRKPSTSAWSVYHMIKQHGFHYPQNESSEYAPPTLYTYARTFFAVLQNILLWVDSACSLSTKSLIFSPRCGTDSIVLCCRGGGGGVSNSDGCAKSRQRCTRKILVSSSATRWAIPKESRIRQSPCLVPCDKPALYPPPRRVRQFLPVATRLSKETGCWFPWEEGRDL